MATLYTKEVIAFLPWIWHQVSLEFSEIDIESAVESERSCYGGNNLTDKSVEIRVGGPFDAQVTPADVVDGFIVHHKGTVGMF